MSSFTKRENFHLISKLTELLMPRWAEITALKDMLSNEKLDLDIETALLLIFHVLRFSGQGKMSVCNPLTLLSALLVITSKNFLF